MLRNTLQDLGYPQGPTPIQADNACAVGLANDQVKQKRSKAIDMRFYWVKDRVKEGQFIIYWRKGAENEADYFTKHHSPSHHRKMRPRYLHVPEQGKPITGRATVPFPEQNRGCTSVAVEMLRHTLSPRHTSHNEGLSVCQKSTRQISNVNWSEYKKTSCEGVLIHD